MTDFIIIFGIPPISQTTPFLEFSGAESFKKGVVWETGWFLVHLGLKSWKGKHTWHDAFDSCGLTDQALGLAIGYKARIPPISQTIPFLEFLGAESFKKGVVWEILPPPVSQTTPFLKFSGPENFKKGVVWETGPQPYSCFLHGFWCIDSESNYRRPVKENNTLTY